MINKIDWSYQLYLNTSFSYENRKKTLTGLYIEYKQLYLICGSHHKHFWILMYNVQTGDKKFFNFKMESPIICVEICIIHFCILDENGKIWKLRFNYNFKIFDQPSLVTNDDHPKFSFMKAVKQVGVFLISDEGELWWMDRNATLIKYETLHEFVLNVFIINKTLTVLCKNGKILETDGGRKYPKENNIDNCYEFPNFVEIYSISNVVSIMHVSFLSKIIYVLDDGQGFICEGFGNSFTKIVENIAYSIDNWAITNDGKLLHYFGVNCFPVKNVKGFENFEDAIIVNFDAINNNSIAILTSDNSFGILKQYSATYEFLKCDVDIPHHVRTTKSARK